MVEKVHLITTILTTNNVGDKNFSGFAHLPPKMGQLPSPRLIQKQKSRDVLVISANVILSSIQLPLIS